MAWVGAGAAGDPTGPKTAVLPRHVRCGVPAAAVQELQLQATMGALWPESRKARGRSNWTSGEAVVPSGRSHALRSALPPRRSQRRMRGADPCGLPLGLVWRS